MKKQIIMGAVLVLLATAAAQAGIYNQTFTENTVITDNYTPGVNFYGNMSGIPSGATVDTVTVGLSITGGRNADLVAYLYAPDGTLVQLFSKPTAATGAGMDITLSDAGSTSIQSPGGGYLSGTYRPSTALSDLNGAAATDGQWRLNISDRVSSNTSTLVSWSLGVITAVPEPTTWALIIFGASGLAVGIGRYCQARLQRTA